jgi:hypothetical protein
LGRQHGGGHGSSGDPSIQSAAIDYAKGGVKYRKDRQALTVLYSVVPKDVLQHLVGKKSVKDAWETIKILHQGHARVKEAHLQSLTKSYEDLKMEESETVDQFAARFITLINGIRGYGEWMRSRTSEDSCVPPRRAICRPLRRSNNVST